MNLKFMMLLNEYFVYVTVSRFQPIIGVIYVGVTNNLIKRMSQHKHKMFDGFTAKYNVDKLACYERFNLID
jgi:putative endonuclease